MNPFRSGLPALILAVAPSMLSGQGDPIAVSPQIQNRVQSLSKAKAYPEVISFIDSLPEDIRKEFLLEYAAALHGSGQHEGVLTFTEKAAANLSPQRKELKVGLEMIRSLSLFDLGRQEEAIALVLRQERGPNKFHYPMLPLFSFSSKAINRQDWKLLERVAKAALEINPDSGTAKMWLGDALYLQGKIQEAEPALQASVAANPKNANGWANLSGCLQVLKRNEEGIRAADKAVLLDPQCFIARFNRARCLLALEQYEPALEELKTAQTMAKDSPLLPSIESKIRETEAFLKAPKVAPKAVKASPLATKATSRKKP